MMKLIQKMLTVLLVFAGWLTVAQACHEEKNDWLSGHKDKFSTNAITLSTEDTMAFTSTSTSCDAYSFFLHKKYDQVVENAAQGTGEYLNVVATNQGCPVQFHQEFGSALKADFAVVFQGTSREKPQFLIRRFQQVIESNPQLKLACTGV